MKKSTELVLAGLMLGVVGIVYSYVGGGLVGDAIVEKLKENEEKRKELQEEV